MRPVLRSVGLASLVAACLAAPSAGVAEEKLFLSGRIVPGQAIGPLKLGMGEATARRLLRKLGPGARLELRLRKGLSDEYVEYSYPLEFVAYKVGYLGRPGARRVVFISAQYAGNATKEGIGVSVTQARLLRTYRGLLCRAVYNRIRMGYDFEYRLGSRTRRHTVFVVRSLSGWHRMEGPDPPMRVAHIVVREPFQRGGIPAEEIESCKVFD